MSVLFYPKEKEKLKTEKRLLDFIGGRHLQWFFSCDKGENSWKLFENSICDGDFYGVGDENFDEFLKQSICEDDFYGVGDENFDGFLKQSICEDDFYGVEDENFSEFLANSICNKDFQGLKIPFISRKYLQM